MIGIKRVTKMAPTPKIPRDNALVKFRVSCGWLQPKAAEELGVSIATYQRLEAMPVLPKVYALALAGLKAKKRK